jgi:predicted RNA-binding Zn ribbon-like protein
MTSPPHNLQLVIDFVNTLDLDEGTDRTDTPAHLAEWLDERGLRCADGPPPVGDPELEQAVDLRETLRSVLVAHSERVEPTEALQCLEEIAAEGGLGVRFGNDGAVDIGPRAPGYPGVLAQLLVPVAHAAMDGTWARVKACVADDCHWAFYDTSRNRSGRWCDMAVCGNREKVRTYRSRRSD